MVDEIDFNGFAIDPKTNKPIKTTLTNKRCEARIHEAWEMVADQVEAYYGLGETAVESVAFEWCTEGYRPTHATADGYGRVGQQWIRTGNEDLVGVVFMSEYNNQPPFDSDFEVLGGKLEFPTFGFGFAPKMGTLIVYPSAPNFVNANAAVNFGELFQVRIKLSTDTPMRYDSRNFPGDYRTWFRG